MTRQSVCLSLLAVAALAGAWRADHVGAGGLAVVLVVIGVALILTTGFTQEGEA